MKEVVGIEEEVEIFCSLRKEKALHPVRQAVVANILYSSISTRSSGGESCPVLGLVFDKEPCAMLDGTKYVQASFE